MKLSVDQLRPILCTRLREALARRAPPLNRDGWASRAADEIGVSLTAFNNWYYGDNFPGGVAWEILDMHFPGLRAEVMSEITGDKLSAVERELAELKEQIAALHDKAGNGGLRAVPGKGSVS